MQVQKTQNTPNFTGYVSYGLKKHINNLVKDTCKETLQIANENQMPIDVSKIQKYKKMGEDITNTLDTFMAKTHKNTVLEYNPSVSVCEFPVKIKNTKTKTSLRFESCPIYIHDLVSKVTKFAAYISYPNHILKTTLEGMSKFATGLKEFNPVDFDKQLFNKYVAGIKNGNDSKLKNFIRIKKAIKAEKMAPEFSTKPDGIVFGVKRWIAEKIIIKNIKNTNNKMYNSAMKNNIN